MVWLASVAGSDARRAVSYVGVLAVVGLVASVASGRFEGVIAVLAVLGGCYAVILVIDDPPLDGHAAVVGAGLLAIGELAHLSLASRTAVTDEAGAGARRVARIAVLALAAMAVGGVLLALVDLVRAGGIAVELVGAGAAIAAVGLLTLAARDARGSQS